jgi:hypothetical protein
MLVGSILIATRSPRQRDNCHRVVVVKGYHMKRIVLAALMSGAAIAASNPANAAIFIGVGFNGGAIT